MPQENGVSLRRQVFKLRQAVPSSRNRTECEVLFEPLVGLHDAGDEFRIASSVDVESLTIVLVVQSVRLIAPPIAERNAGLYHVVKGFHNPWFGGFSVVVALEV